MLPAHPKDRAVTQNASRAAGLFVPKANARCGILSFLLCLTCLAPTVDVLRRPMVPVVVVTQLVTRWLRAQWRDHEH